MLTGGSGGWGLAFADFAESGADALFGQTGLTLAFALETFQALQGGEEPRRIRLAKYHSRGSFP
jgi:hypothetical protein